MIVTSQESAEAKQAILNAGALKLKNVRFAGKQSANNKLDMEELGWQDEKRTKVIDPLRKIVRHFMPDVLVGVPSGGQEWAVEVGALEGIPVAELVKVDPDAKTFQYASEASQLLVARAIRIGVIEDTTTLRTNEMGVYASCPDIRSKADFCATGWARALPIERIIIPDVPLVAVVEEHIPYNLSSEHPLYQYAVESQSERV